MVGAKLLLAKGSGTEVPSGYLWIGGATLPKDERNEKNSQNATGESLTANPNHFHSISGIQDPICKSAQNAGGRGGEMVEKRWYGMGVSERKAAYVYEWRTADCKWST